MRVLVVDDEKNLADIIALSLKKENYVVDVAYDGETGLDYALSGIYNLIILDVMLPLINGFDILKKLREEKINSKVIMLTAKVDLDDKLTSFNSGADDYLTKPFHMEELIVRIGVQLRKNESLEVKEYLEYDDLRLYLKKSEIYCLKSKEAISLSYTEFHLLEYLISNISVIVSKEQIYDKIWGFDSEIESNNLEAYISFLRKKLKIIDSNVTIKAVRGLGYKLEVLNEEIKK